MPRTQRKLYSTGWRWGSASGITQISALGNAKIYQHVGILALGDAEVLSFALGDAKVPDARYFAFWWNIGLRVKKKVGKVASKFLRKFSGYHLFYNRSS